MVTGEGELIQVKSKQKRKNQQGTWKMRENRKRNKKARTFSTCERFAPPFFFSALRIAEN